MCLKKNFWKYLESQWRSDCYAAATRRSRWYHIKNMIDTVWQVFCDCSEILALWVAQLCHDLVGPGFNARSVEKKTNNLFSTSIQFLAWLFMYVSFFLSRIDFKINESITEWISHLFLQFLTWSLKRNIAKIEKAASSRPFF